MSSPLTGALAARDLARARSVLASDPHALDARDDKGKTPLFVSVEHDDQAGVAFLLDHGAGLDAHAPELNPSAKIWSGPGWPGGGRTTLLHVAARNDAARVVPVLAGRLGVDAIDPHGETALHIAAYFGQPRAAAALLAAGASVDVPGLSGLVPLDFARGIDVARVLLDAGADPDGSRATPDAPIKDYYAWPLFARLKDELPVLELLLARGASPARQRGAVAILAHYGKLAALRLVLEHGGDPDDRLPARAPEASTRTALAAAAGWGRVDIVDLLLARGAAAELHLALCCAAGACSSFSVDPTDPAKDADAREQIVTRLLAAGARPSADVAIDRMTAIHLAAERGTVGMLRAMLATDGAIDLDGADREGRTPLVIAAARGDLAIVTELIAAGADGARPDLLGRTPYQAARKARGEGDYVQIMSLLSRHGWGLATPPPPAAPIRRVGARVSHPKFGEGVVTAISDGAKPKATVVFGSETRTLLVEFVTWLEGS